MDSWLPVHDPQGSGVGCRCMIHNQESETMEDREDTSKQEKTHTGITQRTQTKKKLPGTNRLL